MVEMVQYEKNATGINLLDNSTTDSNWTVLNGTFGPGGGADNDYIFDRPDVQAIFISLYTIVFISCFVGNLLVILVVTLHWRMRSITNFCLANLAFADLCVGVFCVYQNLSTYLIASWVFGDFLCKMYHFINTLSHTASILILVVICIERYLAIIHPMQCKQLLTLNRLRVTIVSVWVLSALYSAPRLYYINTVTIKRDDGEVEIICIPTRTLYDSVIFDMLSMFLLFILPLSVISFLYTRIGIALWRSSQNNMPNTSASETSSSSYRDIECPANNSHSHSRRSLWSSCLRKNRRRRNRSDSFECEASNAQTNYTDCEIHRPRLNGHGGNMNYGSANSSPYHNNTHCNGNNPGGSADSSPIISNTEPIILVKFEGNGTSSFKREKRRSKCTILFNASSSSSTSRSPSRRSSHRSSRRSSQRHPPQRNQECQDCLLNNSNSNPGAAESRVPQPHSSLLTSNGTVLMNENSPFVSPETIPSPIHSNTTNSSNATTSTTTTEPNKVKLKRMRVVRSCKYGTRALQSRRRIIRMLIVIVVTFAVCNLPFHARKMWQNWSPNYRGGSTFSSIFTPATFLIMYANSGINPLLYAFLSQKFRLSFRDLLCCKLRQSVRVFRRTSARSAHLVPLSTAI